MSEDVRSLKVRLMKTQGELQQYKTAYAALEARVSELYQWSQSAQKSLAERDQYIAQLQQYIQNQTQQKDNMDANLQELIQRCNHLENQVNKDETLLNKARDAMFKSLINSDLPSIIAQVFEEVLWQRGTPAHKLFVLLRRRRSAASVHELKQESGLNSSQTQDGITILLKNEVIRPFGRDVYIMANVASASDTDQPLREEEFWESLSIEELFTSLEKRIRSSQGSAEISQILTTLRDVLQKKLGNAIFLFEITRAAQEWTRGSGNVEEIIEKMIDWRVKTEEKLN
ncbi:MAG: hypothetical protein ACFFBD_01660 [Candidatus Hodarchaeota archaeon]